MVGEPDQGSVPPPGSDPEPKPDPGLIPFARVQQTARSIEDRIRKALNPTGADVATLRVLVVDDHPDAADSLGAVLELLGCAVRVSYDGPSALAAADEFEPQVCLLDLKMPGMDGLELAARLKARAAGRPLVLIAVTALGDAESKARTALAGFHGHITKPVDVQTLAEEISRHWGAVGGTPGAPPGDPPAGPPEPAPPG